MSLSAKERGRLGALARWANREEESAERALLILEGSGKEGIERELKVVRILPNPRMVLCEYWELAQHRTCVVNVGRNKRFLKGMRFKMREPLSEEEFARPWVYRGKAPRRKGRW